MSSPVAIDAEELAAFIAGRNELIAERDALAGALRVVTTERDLALERLFERASKAARSHASHAASSVTPVGAARPGSERPAWKGR